MLVGSTSTFALIVLAVYLLLLPTLHMALTATVVPFQKPPPLPTDVIIAAAVFALFVILSLLPPCSEGLADGETAKAVLPALTSGPADPSLETGKKPKLSLVDRLRSGCFAPSAKKQPELV